MVDDNTPLEVPEISRDGRLRGRTAIVTGAGSYGSLTGSGSAIATLFAVKGASVVIADIDEGRAQHTLQTIERLGGRASICVADITKPEHCARVVDLSLTTYGDVDILVNNAAVAPSEQDNSEEEWDFVINLNLKAAKLMVDAVVPPMAAQRRGAIVNITSVAALRAGGGVAYTAAKGGLNALTKALAFKYGRLGIRVNNVAPGHNALPMGLGFRGWDDSDNRRVLRAEAGMLGYEGDGWDIAYAALFLASDEARWVTAATVPVDSGTTEVFPIVMYPVLRAADDRASEGLTSSTGVDINAT